MASLSSVTCSRSHSRSCGALSARAAELLLASHQQLARKLDILERKYDAQFGTVFAAIRQLMIAEASPKRRIGFGRSD